ncbi:hypothetical protein L9F63_021016 [Diploptera punctata]|uniref:MICOS complex subunit MIC13 n=1 Tax=Diploptera punctata TaxID=6984 RepID=A0AAD8EBX0_DIPPU|nr:hypothetical protein L9F63_021016 [Diploptera punctata]
MLEIVKYSFQTTRGLKQYKEVSHVFYSTSNKVSKIRTINPADRLCVKNPPTKFLVKTDHLKNPCAKPKVEYYQPPRATPIYICKPQDLKKIVQPSPCKCPAKRPPKSILQVIRETIWFGMKLGVAGAVVYVTIDYGLWGSSEETSCLYSKMYYHLQLLLNNECEEDPQVPRLDVVTHSAGRAWNKGVSKVCETLWYVPKTIIQCVKDFIWTEKAIKEQRVMDMSKPKDGYSCR